MLRSNRGDRINCSEAGPRLRSVTSLAPHECPAKADIGGIAEKYYFGLLADLPQRNVLKCLLDDRSWGLCSHLNFECESPLCDLVFTVTQVVVGQ